MVHYELPFLVALFASHKTRGNKSSVRNIININIINIIQYDFGRTAINGTLIANLFELVVPEEENRIGKAGRNFNGHE